MANIGIRVECYEGYRAEQEPLRFEIGGRWLEVAEILDRWHGPDHRYFKLRADDGGVYILRQQDPRGWELYMYDGAGSSRR